VLEVPCLNTERPITITGGTNQLVGRHPDRIVRAACEVLDAPPPRRGHKPCGTGKPASASQPS
jgi:UDP-N-acetylglucosamine 2-epimerase (non-hydrolysing)